MKLLFVIPEFYPKSDGGIATFYRELLPEFAKLGHSVNVLVSDGRHVGYPSVEIDGCLVSYVTAAVHGKWIGVFSRYSAMFPWIAENLALAWAAWECCDGGRGYEHVETTDWPLLFVPWVASGASVKTTVQLHGSHGQISEVDPSDSIVEDFVVQLIERECLRSSQFLQANSSLNGAIWSKKLGRGVDIERPGLAGEAKVFDGDIDVGRSRKAVVFGRLSRGKGALLLAESIRAGALRGLPVEWFGSDTWNAASGSTFSSFMADEYGSIEGRKLSFKGVAGREVVREEMKTALCVLVPTLFDAFNFTALEAMVSGSVVICSSYAGVSELIVDGATGFIYDPHTRGSLERAVMEMQSLGHCDREKMVRKAAAAAAECSNPAESARRRASRYSGLEGSPVGTGLCDAVRDFVSGNCSNSLNNSILGNFGLRDISSAFIKSLLSRVFSSN